MVELHRLEKRLLIALKDGERLSIKEASKRAGLPEASVMRASMWLIDKGLATVEEERRTKVRLGEEGRRFAEEGMPESLLVEAVVKHGGEVSLEKAAEVCQLSPKMMSVAIGWARRKGWVKVGRKGNSTVLTVMETAKFDATEEELIQLLSKSARWLEDLSPAMLGCLKRLMERPNVILKEEEVERFIRLTDKGISIAQTVGEAEEEVSQLTPELIRSGEWKKVKFRRYNIRAPVAKAWPGKKQPYRRFLDNLKQSLVALGFEEMEGPIVELMFYNCDALYMPQDHPAREIHDIYFPENPRYGLLSEREQFFLERVKAAHENGWETGSIGWGYKFSTKEARRLVLRSQGTALSARTLISRDLKIPGKYFSISRCYRPDVVDRTHLTEFDQVEGIVVGEGLTFRDLLGVLEMFAVEVAKADKVRFRPDYFPFTEPSVELAAYKEGFGWIEFGGAGMFRPEVTLPLGVEVPVVAWGLGVNRLFMMQTGVDDIRELYTQDLDWLRRQRLR